LDKHFVIFPQERNDLFQINNQYYFLFFTKIMKAMLEYVKTILKKVSFDSKLFEKELVKAIKVLIQPELQELKKWCYDQYGDIYINILNRHLAHIPV